MKRRFFANKKAMSIVISTVIIIAISITMSIAVAFWAMGLGNSFTRFEKLEFVSIYVDTATAQATAAVSGINPATGAVTAIAVTNGGSGYTATPTVTLTGGSGTGATARVNGLANGVITSIQVYPSGGTGYQTNPPIVTIGAPAAAGANFPVYIQLKNTGSAAATINNLFLDGKPFNVVGAQTNLVASGTAQPVVLQVGQRNNNFFIYLPRGATWSSGDYVEIEIQTSAGRLYSNTVLIP